MTFIEDIHNTEKQAKSLVDDANITARDTEESAKDSKEQELSSLNRSLQKEKTETLARLEEESKTRLSKEEQNSLKKAEDITASATQNKKAAVQFVVEHI